MDLITFLDVAYFSLGSIIGLVVYSFWASQVGCVMSLRREVFATIALPAVVHAILALTMVFPIHIDHKWMVVLLAVPVLYVLKTLIVKLSFLYGNREALYGGLYVMAVATVALVSNVQWRGQTELRSLLNGEILMVNSMDVMIISAFTILHFFFFVKYKGEILLQAWKDEKRFHCQKRHIIASRVIELSTLFCISYGSVLFGPLASSAILIIPALILSARVIGLGALLRSCLLLAFFSSLIGFLLSIYIDMPPVQIVVVCLVVFSVIFPFPLLKKL